MGSLRAAREWATPTRKSSAFLDKGVLTPEEFVRAGDELVFRCPTWSWEAGEESKRKSHLPQDKQYLVTRHVPCQARVSTLEQVVDVEQDAEDDWMVSTIGKPKEIEDEFDIIDGDGEIVETKPPVEEVAAEDDYADMDAFVDDNLIADDAAAVVETSNLEKVRTYDVSITYDKYYQTPRVWLVGTSADGQPLSGKEMMEDVIADYANKTVTIEAHPLVSGPHASIHPCQHAKVMKTIIRNLTSMAGEGDEGPAVENYLFCFLKFVSSIIPNINYDSTMDVTASTAK